MPDQSMTDPQPYEYDSPPEPWRDYRMEMETNPEVANELGRRLEQQAEAHLAEQGLTMDRSKDMRFRPLVGEQDDPNPLRFHVTGWAVPAGTVTQPGKRVLP